MRNREAMGFALGLSVAIVLAPLPARAGEPELGLISLGAGAGPYLFEQLGHAPPLCCPERDEWVAMGGQVRLEATLALGSTLRLFAGGGYAYSYHLVGGEADRVRVLDGRLGLDVLAWRNDDTVVGIGLFGSYLYASGTFPREGRDATLSAPAVGARVRVDFPRLFTESTGLALDVSGAHAFVQRTWSSSALFVWAR